MKSERELLLFGSTIHLLRNGPTRPFTLKIHCDREMVSLENVTLVPKRANCTKCLLLYYVKTKKRIDLLIQEKVALEDEIYELLQKT